MGRRFGYGRIPRRRGKRARETTTSIPILDKAEVAALAASVGCELLEPGDDGYDDARRVHNGLIDRRPALIVRCRTAADVAAAVRFARRGGLEISVRGGGHNVAGLRGRGRRRDDRPGRDEGRSRSTRTLERRVPRAA